jgi:hypothetical protein
VWPGRKKTPKTLSEQQVGTSVFTMAIGHTQRKPEAGNWSHVMFHPNNSFLTNTMRNLNLSQKHAASIFGAKEGGIPNKAKVVANHSSQLRVTALAQN